MASLAKIPNQKGSSIASVMVVVVVFELVLEWESVVEVVMLKMAVSIVEDFSGCFAADLEVLNSSTNIIFK